MSESDPKMALAEALFRSIYSDPGSDAVDRAWTEARLAQGYRESRLIGLLADVGFEIRPVLPAGAHGSLAALLDFLDRGAKLEQTDHLVVAHLPDDAESVQMVLDQDDLAALRSLVAALGVRSDTSQEPNDG
jgi:hypothetical protein